MTANTDPLFTNIVPIENALASVSQLNGIKYNLSQEAFDNGFVETRVKLGLNYNEVEAVAPEAVVLAQFDAVWDEETSQSVSRTGENYKTVQYARLVPILIEAIKELKLRIETLEG